MKRIKRELAAIFEIVDMQPLTFYISLKVTCNCKQRTIKLLQPSYIEKLLD